MPFFIGLPIAQTTANRLLDNQNQLGAPGQRPEAPVLVQNIPEDLYVEEMELLPPNPTIYALSAQDILSGRRINADEVVQSEYFDLYLASDN